ncbi:MAG: MerR family transcriptional regulator [Oscillospiraceae bacterium]|nr:MerR family transcriptional regulator [Oscillospiraceae bacterium]
MAEKSFYTIGEMARISGLPEKTLRYYDEIGLLSPAHRQGTGSYRMYSSEQLEHTLLLQSLKSLGMSLKDIRNEFENMSSRRYEELLRLQADAIDAEISELKRKRDNLISWIADVDEALTAEKGLCYLRDYPEQRGYFYETRISSRTELELAMRETEKKYGSGTHIGRVARIVSVEDFLKGNTLVYSGLFIPASSVSSSDCAEYMVLKKSKYAVVFEAAMHKDSAAIWEKLKLFAENEGYRISGPAERSIPVEAGISKKENDYVARYRFPVEKKNK